MSIPCSKRAIVNLARQGRKARLVLGTVGVGATMGAASWMILEGVDPLWRWSLFLPAFCSFVCLLEAWWSTCVVLAALGAWDLGCGTQKVPDPGLEEALRQRSWKILLVSAVLAMGLTILAVSCSHSA